MSKVLHALQVMRAFSFAFLIVLASISLALLIAYTGLVSLTVASVLAALLASATLIALEYYGLLSRVATFAAAPLLKQVPRDVIAARAAEAFDLLLYWHKENGRSPDEVIEMRTMLYQPMPGGPCRVEVHAKRDGIKYIAAYRDRELQHLLHRIVKPKDVPARSYAEIRHVGIGDRSYRSDPQNNEPPWIVLKANYKDLSNHARLRIEAAGSQAFAKPREDEEING
jgi:hypothetical protein